MPELPEVETVRSQIEPYLVGSTVINADSHPSDKFTPALEVIGSQFQSVHRRGKFILAATDAGQEFIVHLGMTGKVSFSDSLTDNPYRRAWLELDDSMARYFEFIDVRRFGRLRLVEAGDYSKIATLKTMGPEPFGSEVNVEDFWAALKKSSRAIKTQLLSQRPIAGVGNIYADEALWMAKINPTAKTISKQRAKDLLEAIQVALQKGIDNGGTTLRDYRNAFDAEGQNQHELLAYGRAGEPCLRCGKALSSKVIDARTTTWCSNCQRR